MSPLCDSRKVAGIRYGKHAMTPELELAIKRGEVVLGGCAQHDKLAWHCNHRWH